jgi:hypothetical protein
MDGLAVNKSGVNALPEDSGKKFGKNIRPPSSS